MILSGKFTKEAVQLESFFPKPELEELYGFKSLHNTVISANTNSIEPEIKAASSISIDAADSDGRTPLSWAAYRGDAHAVQILLSHGADCDRANLAQRSPLMFAARSSQECVDLLLEAKANLEARSQNGSNALHLAAQANAKRGPLGIVKSVVRAGAPLNVQKK